MSQAGESPWRIGSAVERIGRSWRRRGPRRTLQRSLRELGDLASVLYRGASPYERWLAERLRARLATLGEEDLHGPMISILMPVCDPEPRWLQAAIQSVIAQVYPDWQLCIVNDASEDPRILALLSEWSLRDPRIEIASNRQRHGISRTSNRALSAARGEYVALLDHDDTLSSDALAQVARSARMAPFDILYTDEDKIDRRGRFRDPTFKPARSPELLRSCMYFGHLCVYRRDLLSGLGGFDPRFDGSQDHDLALRAEARAERVVHLPEVLYHWRMAPGSAADPVGNAKPWAYAAGRRAIEADLERRGERGRVVDGVARGHSRILRPAPSGHLVSILYCGCCIRPGSCESAVGPPPGVDVEWIEIDRMPESGAGAIGRRWNAAAARASGDVLIFLAGARPRRMVRSEDRTAWLSELVAQTLRRSVGAVGVRISSPRGALVHMGVVLAGEEFVRSRTPDLQRDEPGPLCLAQSLREVAAVTGGCLAIRHRVFDELGGLDPRYETTFHDIDFCLRVRATGRIVLYDPFAECEKVEQHVEGPELGPGSSGRHGLPRSGDEDLARLRERWQLRIREPDPYFNPNFHQRGPLFVPAFRPCSG